VIWISIVAKRCLNRYSPNCKLQKEVLLKWPRRNHHRGTILNKVRGTKTVGGIETHVDCSHFSKPRSSERHITDLFVRGMRGETRQSPMTVSYEIVRSLKSSNCDFMCRFCGCNFHKSGWWVCFSLVLVGWFLIPQNHDAAVWCKRQKMYFQDTDNIPSCEGGEETSFQLHAAWATDVNRPLTHKVYDRLLK